MAHAIWNGAITFGLVTIPVKLYSAIHEHELRFNLLHRKDGGRIRYRRVCDACGEEVPWKDVVRGFPHGKDEYVEVEDADFEKASPETSREVRIVEFVDLAEIDPVLFDAPYYLAPEKRGRRAYVLLREALRDTGKVGIARVMLRSREHLAALKPNGRALVIELMHWSDEVVAPTELDFPEENAKLEKRELKMATSLIDSMSAPFDPGSFHDEYREKLLSLIEARAEGKPRPRAAPRAQGRVAVVDLADLLRKSLAATRTRRGAGAKHRNGARRTRRHAA